MRRRFCLAAGTRHLAPTTCATWRTPPPPTARRYALAPMAEPTDRDIDALWGPATPQFAYQIAVRVRDLIADLPADDPVRRYGEHTLVELDRLGHGTGKGDEDGH